jgi:hypothetical protein
MPYNLRNETMKGYIFVAAMFVTGAAFAHGSQTQGAAGTIGGAVSVSTGGSDASASSTGNGKASESSNSFSNGTSFTNAGASKGGTNVSSGVSSASGANVKSTKKGNANGTADAGGSTNVTAGSFGGFGTFTY